VKLSPLTNNSVFDIQTDEDLQHTSGTISTFINNGSVSKTLGSNTTSFGVYMFNSGAVQASSGAIAFGDTYDQTSLGTLNVRIGGISPTIGFDRYIVSQSAVLSGTLAITLVNSYEPDLGDTFEIMTFSSRSGIFSSIDGLIIGSGKRFEVFYGSTNLVLEVVPE
jgi:hypothetical protein